MKRSALRTYIGLGLELGFGLLPLVVQVLLWGSHIPSEYILREELITCASIGIANFALTAVALSLFWAVRDRRLNRVWAALLFVAAAAVSVFVPLPLMHASRLFWPDTFHGDSGWTLVLAPLLTAPFVAVPVIAFGIGLVFARWHSPVEPSQPTVSSRGRPDWFLRASLLGGVAVIVCSLLVWVFLSIDFRLAHPVDPGGHVNLAAAASAQGRPDEAIAEYRKALETKPDNAEAHCGLALVLTKIGRTDEAMAYFQKALMIKPGYAEAHYGLGVTLVKMNRVAEAVAHLRMALELKPDYAEARQSLKRALETRNVPSNDSSTAHAASDAAAAPNEMDQVAEALIEYQKALTLKPNDPEAQYRYGVALTSGHRVDEAITQFRKALILKPDYAEAHYQLGLALADKGKHAEAIAEYKKALAIKPDYDEARQRLNDAAEMKDQGR